MARASTVEWRHDKVCPERVVLAVGLRTDHWKALMDSCPEIVNCCMDVRDLLGRQWDDGDPGDGSGMDTAVRHRMKEKPAWSVLWVVAMVIMERFGILVVVCNWGKHRSLSLAYEVANHLNCELISPRNRAHSVRLSDVQQFSLYLAPRLRLHSEQHGNIPHPLVDVKLCVANFDGPEWSRRNDDEGYNHEWLHNMVKGDIIMQITNIHSKDTEWQFGTILHHGDATVSRWYNPKMATSMPKDYYPGVQDIAQSLTYQHMLHTRPTRIIL